MWDVYLPIPTMDGLMLVDTSVRKSTISTAPNKIFRNLVKGMENINHRNVATDDLVQP
jgi:hypothetical protein